MGSGKSVIGRKLAASLGLPFIDLDLEFESLYKITIENFFKKYSEDVFRNLESKVLRQTETLSEGIISTGGGTPCFHKNMEFINSNGTSIYLKASTEILLERILSSHKPRPLLMNLSKAKMLEKIDTMLNQRKKYYEEAKITVESNNCDINGLVEVLGTLK